MTEQESVSLLRTQPLSIAEGIPIFSTVDKYVENYKKIASDHVAAMTDDVQNPFIGNELWLALEQSTRGLVEKYAPTGARILDVGVGLGRLLGPMSQYERHGIDISLDYLKFAQDAGIKIAFSKIEDMPYCDAVFDMVIVCDVLEHVLDLNACCRQILRVLKPGGILIVRVPFREDLSPYLNPDLPYEYIHLRAFDAPGLQLLFGKIFEMGFLESHPVAPFLQGAPRLKLQLFPEEQLVVLRNKLTLLSESAQLFLRPLMEVSLEQLTRWVYELRDSSNEDYRCIENELVQGIDINAVFRKAGAI